MGKDDLTLRYAHCEGLSSICYDESGECIISCGCDGNVRIWKGSTDDSPKQIKAGDKVYDIAIQNENLFVATDNNSVDRYEFPSGSENGILARFTGNVTCLAVSESKKLVAAGSSDFDMKVLTDDGKQKCFLGHQAPVLSVAIDPMDEFLASTSCDGTMKIWKLSNQSVVSTVKVFKPSNDIGNSEQLGKLCWRPATGEDIAVPVKDGVSLFSKLTWQIAQSFKCDEATKAFQCCAFSPCGRFIAAGTVDGWIVVWDAETQECLRKLQHPMKSCVCAVAWNPKENNSLAVSDTRGQIGVFENVVPSEQPTNKRTQEDDDIDALFDDDDDNMIVDLMAAEDNADVAATGKKKQRALEDSDDDNDLRDATQSSDLPPIPSTLDVFASDSLDQHLAPPTIPSASASRQPIEDDASSVATGGAVPATAMIKSVTMQPPFQPSSTPVHLSHRFMVYNSVGIVRSYNDDVENAIDIEFHDAQTHHPLHLANNDRYVMADLSPTAAVLAAEATELGSKLKCVHFSSWDNNKEWSVNMPDGEEIRALTTGDGWIAACTDAQQVRLFATGGTQRQVFSIPGPVVAMAAHTDQLMIAYHVTQGFGSNQCLGFSLLELGVGSGCKPRKVAAGQPLPISPGSTLAWLGFSAEGTPATVDSDGVIRFMSRSFCEAWSVVLKTKPLTKSRYDHYWVVGLHENPQQVRCILCKGINYPPTLPRPTLSVLEYKLPMCDLESDKGKYEEEYWRSKLFSSHVDYLTSRGYEEDAEAKRKNQLELQHSLMRLFALCCKTDQDFKAHEVCSLMPSSASMNLAVKYASRMRKIMLAQRLSELVQEKSVEEAEAARAKHHKAILAAAAEQEESEEEEEGEDEDFRSELQAGYSASETEWTRSRSKPRPTASQSSRTAGQAADDDDVTSIASQQTPEPEQRPKSSRSLSSQLAGTRRNPFKKSTASTPTAPPSGGGGGVLDNIKRTTPNPPRKNVGLTETSGKKSKAKDSAKKSGQSTLFGTKLNLTSTPKPKKQAARTKIADHGDLPKMKEGLNDENETSESAEGRNDGELVVLKDKLNSDAASAPSGDQVYMEEKLGEIRREHPDLDGVGARKLALQRFRALDEAEKEAYAEKARLQAQDVTAPPSGHKRKHEEASDEEENAPPEEQQEDDLPKLKRRKESIPTARSRLSAFAFQSQD